MSVDLLAAVRTHERLETIGLEVLYIKVGGIVQLEDLVVGLGGRPADDIHIAGCLHCQSIFTDILPVNILQRCAAIDMNSVSAVLTDRNILKRSAILKNKDWLLAFALAAVTEIG